MMFSRFRAFLRYDGIRIIKFLLTKIAGSVSYWGRQRSSYLRYGGISPHHIFR